MISLTCMYVGTDGFVKQIGYCRPSDDEIEKQAYIELTEKHNNHYSF